MTTSRTTSRPLAIALVVVGLGSAAHAAPWSALPKAAADDAGGNKEEAAQKKAQQKGRAFIKLRQILKKGEPTIREVQRATLKFYKLEPERIKRMAVATRVKALVPEVEGSIDNSVGHTFTNQRDGLYPAESLAAASRRADGSLENPDGFKERVATANDNFLWRVRAVWNLDRLVFNSEELDVKSLNSLEENLVREVTTMFFARQRLIANLILSGPDEDEEIFYELLKLDEMTATLDALSGGMFSPRAWKWEGEVKW